MSIIIKLKGLPLEAASVDVRLYFEGLTIPDGGVHIVGGDEGTVFVEFASDEDARQAMVRDDGKIKNSQIKLSLSSRNEMQTVTDAARQQKLKYQQEQLNLQQQQHHHHLDLNHHQHQLQVPTTTTTQLLPLQQQQQNIQTNQGQTNSYLNSTALAPMGPALLTPSHQTHLQQPQQQQQPLTQSIPFEGDPRMLSQNYQGMLNVINNNNPQSPKNQQQQPSSQQQQPRTQTTQPSPFIDPRILSQNYQGMMSVAALQQQQISQTLLPQQQVFNQFPPTTMANGGLGGLNLLGSIGLGGAPDLALNSVAVSNAGTLVGAPMGALTTMGTGGVVGVGGGSGGVGGVGLLDSNGNNNATIQANRNRSPDSRARMSGMRGGDDKLFANKRCVLAASNIPYRATSKDIIEFLSEFNIKEDCIRRRYNQKGQPTADAKIAFSSPDAAMKAMKMMNKKTLCGRPVFLKPV